MKFKVFEDQIKHLQNRFLRNLTSEQTTSFWTILKDEFTDDEFIIACDWIVKNGDDFFPTANKFFEWKRQHVKVVYLPPIKCETCGINAAFGGQSNYELTYECKNGHITVVRV